MTILVTGAAGFIGFHVAQSLLDCGERVICVDNLNAYYEVRLKRDRLAQLVDRPGFIFHQGDIADRRFTEGLASAYPQLTRIVHLAAQAGVRASRTHPHGYVTANVMGQLCILELARSLGGRCAHLVYASSSSVYGADSEAPFNESQRVDAPMSLYAATKRSDELIGYSYASQYGIPMTGLRFFTVYGPWGRPDMAYFTFARAIRDQRPITLYDGGRLRRDFTYIDDIVAGVVASLANPPCGAVPARVLNIGNSDARPVSELVEILQENLHKRAIIRDEPRPSSEILATCADVSRLEQLTGIAPTTSLEKGISRFIKWFNVWDRSIATEDRAS